MWKKSNLVGCPLTPIWVQIITQITQYWAVKCSPIASIARIKSDISLGTSTHRTEEVSLVGSRIKRISEANLSRQFERNQSVKSWGDIIKVTCGSKVGVLFWNKCFRAISCWSFNNPMCFCLFKTEFNAKWNKLSFLPSTILNVLRMELKSDVAHEEYITASKWIWLKDVFLAEAQL